MENNLPSEEFRPEDEYPALDAQPIEAAEPVAETAQEPSDAPVEAPSELPQDDQLPDIQAQAMQPPYPQGAVPYMPYPMYPPTAGTPQYPQPPYPQQPPYPPQGTVYPGYVPYYPPYPPQQPGAPVQPQGYVPPQQGVPTQPQGYIPQQPYVMPQYPAAPQPGQQPAAPPQTAPAQTDAPFTVDEVVPEPKKSTSTGTKAFLLILSALLLAMVAGFIVYIVNSSNKSAQKNTNDFFPIDNGDLFGEPDDDEPYAEELKHTETEEEIKLVADDGATQKRDSDNPDSVGTPDKNAKGIELKDTPKDADDDSKYTAKSSFNTLVDCVVTISCYQDKITENIYDQISGGSGTIISADGYIITNAHVLNNSKEFAVGVTLNNGEKYQAKIIGYDTWTDLAVLKIDAKNLKAAEFGDSEKVEVGDDVITIGSPGGAKYQNTLTQGVVSALDREISVNKLVRYIQSDAAINPGSSGGPLCNLYGQVVGITTAKTTAKNYENMSFSIPSSTVKEITEDLIRYGYVPDRPRIGFSGSEVTSDYKLYYGLPSGVIVGEIADDGALKDSGVKENDIITAIDGESVASFQDIYNILSKHKAGDKVKLSIYRIEDTDFFKTEEEPTIDAK